MKNIILIALLVAGAALALLLVRQAPQPAMSGQSALDSSALMASPAPQAAERVKVTARGKGIQGEGWSHDHDKQARQTAPGLVRNPVQADGTQLTGKIGIRVKGGAGGPFQGVAVDSAAVHEGNLFRIHVDSPGQGQGQLLVLGFYSELWSEAAVNDQAYACKRCGNVRVCGVAPECF